MIAYQPLGAVCGAEITGIDLSGPISDQDKEQFRALLREYGLLVIRGQKLEKSAQVEFSKLFGELAIHPIATQVDPEQPELLVLDSHGRDGNIEPPNPEEIVGNIDWHTDLAYVPVPNYAGVLHVVILPPEGGMTGFVDRQKVYDALPDAMKRRLEGLTVVQSWRHSQEQISKNPSFRSDEGAKVMDMNLFPDLGFPLVFDHPFNGSKVLNITKMWSSDIVELPDGEAKELIDELLEHTLQDKFVYWHKYEAGDVVLWDNYRMMHAASGTKGKHRRRLYRTTIKGEVALGGLPLDPEEGAAAARRTEELKQRMSETWNVKA